MMEQTAARTLYYSSKLRDLVDPAANVKHHGAAKLRRAGFAMFRGPIIELRFEQRHFAT